MSKIRAKNLTAVDIQDIVGLLDGWSGKLTWERLIEEIYAQKRCRYTRQALFQHATIKNAYQIRKNSLPINSEKFAKKSYSELEIEKMVERISRLTAENERLKLENDRFSEQFVLWASNAYYAGISEKRLWQPLLPVDREVSKKRPNKIKSDN